MRKILGLSLIAIGLAVAWLSIQDHQPPDAISSDVSPPQKQIKYQSHPLDFSVVHTLLIPANSGFSVTPAISEQLITLEDLAQKHQAVAAINGGFFDPNNQKTTSIVIKQGQLVADPRNNQGLIQNPNLQPYMDKILNRSEFRRYRCGSTVRYDITLHSEPTPPGCQLIDALGSGPLLVPQITSVTEGFVAVENGKVIRDALGSSRPNARSAVGITPDGSILLVIVAQKPEAPRNSGMSFRALATFLKIAGVEKAMNLDGGSSSALYYNGKTVYGRVDKNGNRIKRKIKSILMVNQDP